MLSANVCAANYLLDNPGDGIYRNHETPSEEKLTNLRDFLLDFGLTLGGGSEPTVKDYGKILKKIANRPDSHLLQTVLLRSMRQAAYSNKNLGHFGLAYSAYTHFTSPIRRYPDLMVHRAIKSQLNGKAPSIKNIEATVLHCSTTERTADEATRDVESWLKCYFMQDKVGQSFWATVAGVTGFGLFMELDDIYIEGLLHVTELGNDYFTFDKARHSMVGEKTNLTYRLGACFRVADAMGVDALICPKDNAVGLNATVRKVACGGAESVPFVVVTNLARTIRYLKDSNIFVYGTDDEAKKSLHKINFKGSIALVMGSEGKGMRRLTKELCDDIFSIPMMGQVESLNVSVASGICMYEINRQKS